MAKCSFITIFLLDLPDKSLCFSGCFKSLCAALVCNHQSSRNKDAVSYSHIAQLLSDTIKFSLFLVDSCCQIWVETYWMTLVESFFFGSGRFQHSNLIPVVQKLHNHRPRGGSRPLVSGQDNELSPRWSCLELWVPAPPVSTSRETCKRLPLPLSPED